MHLSTLPRFLIGRRSAIEEIAGSRGAIVYGIIFTISAGLAREYDGEDLLHEPWHIFVPLAASFVVGSVLFLAVYEIARLTKGSPPATFGMGALYRSFMSLFWMTAPLAWLYAVPYEYFLEPVDAMAVNLWTLALVSAWRVLLITRVSCVLFGVRFLPAFLIVMLFADILAFIVAMAAPKPVIAIMGGIRYSDVDRLVLNTTMQIISLSVMTAPVWLIGALIGSQFIKRDWPPAPPRSSAGGRRGILMLAIGSVLVWIPLLVMTQPDQQRKNEAEHLLREGRVAEAFSQMSAHGRYGYPPLWDPPPRTGYQDPEPTIGAVMNAMRTEWPAPWVADIYIHKIKHVADAAKGPYGNNQGWSDYFETIRWDEQTEDYKQQMAYMIRGGLPVFQFVYEYDKELTQADKKALSTLIELCQTVDKNEIEDTTVE